MSSRIPSVNTSDVSFRVGNPSCRDKARGMKGLNSACSSTKGEAKRIHRLSVSSLGEEKISVERREQMLEERTFTYQAPDEQMATFDYLSPHVLLGLQHSSQKIEVESRLYAECFNSQFPITYLPVSTVLNEKQKEALSAFYHHTLNAIRFLDFNPDLSLNNCFKKPIHSFNIDALYEGILHLRFMGIHCCDIYNTLHDASLAYISNYKQCKRLSRGKKSLLMNKFISKLLKKISSQKKDHAGKLFSSKKHEGFVVSP